MTIGQHFVAAAYADNATLTFVPSAAGASGKPALDAFFARNRIALKKLQSSAVANADDEFVTVKECSEMAGGAGTVEEVLVSLVHDVDMEWLLAGVKPTGRKILLPMTVITRFSDDGLVVAKRFYYDQATVMRQIGLLPSDVNKLPVSKALPVNAKIMPVLTGFEAAERFMNETDESKANVLLKKLFGGDQQSAGVSFGQQAPLAVSSRRGGHSQDAGHRDSVGDLFSGTSTSETSPVHASSRFNTQIGGGKSNLYAGGVASDNNVNQSDHVGGRRHNAKGNESHFSLAHDPTPKLAELHLSKRPGSAYHNADSQENLVAMTEDAIKPHLEPVHTGRRLGVQQRNASTLDDMWTSATAPNEEEKIVASEVQDKLKQQQQVVKPSSGVDWAASSNGLGTMQNRPSSRVLKPPGGGSTFSFA